MTNNIYSLIKNLNEYIYIWNINIKYNNSYIYICKIRYPPLSIIKGLGGNIEYYKNIVEADKNYQCQIKQYKDLK